MLPGKSVPFNAEPVASHEAHSGQSVLPVANLYFLIWLRQMAVLFFDEDANAVHLIRIKRPEIPAQAVYLFSGFNSAECLLCFGAEPPLKRWVQEFRHRNPVRNIQIGFCF